MQNSFINLKALITGASSGIGASTALLLAEKGIQVILTARRTDRLNQLTEKILASGGRAIPFPFDLTLESDRIALYAALLRQDLLPDILINNAGSAWYGYFHEMPWQVAQDILNLNISATTHLTTLFLPHMVSNGFGRIINVGSIAGKLPEQGIALYSASKAYLDAFSKVLHRELKGTGVIASVLRAGPVKTEFFDTAKNLEKGDTIPAEKLAIPVELVSRAIWHLLLHPKRVKYVPAFMRISPLLEYLFSGVIDQLGPLLLRNRHSSSKTS